VNTETTTVNSERDLTKQLTAQRTGKPYQHDESIDGRTTELMNAWSRACI